MHTHSGIQSHHISSLLTFKAFIIFNLAFRVVSSFQHSESCLHFSIQSHVQLGIQCQHLSLVFSVQSRCAYSFLSHHLSNLLAFRVISHQPYHSKSQLLAFIFTGIVSLAFTVLHPSSFFSPRYFMLIVSSPCSSIFPHPLHMTQSFKFTAHILVILLGTPRLAFSCSSHKAVSFGHILSYTSRQFDHYSTLILFFESLLEMLQGESGSLAHLQRRFEKVTFLLRLKPFRSSCWFEQVCVLLVFLWGYLLFFGRVHFISLTTHTFFSLQCLYSLHS